jgi:hypothetical protein
MTEAAKLPLVSLVEAWADRFEEWPEFAEAALATARAQPNNLGLRGRLEGIAQRRWRKGPALLRLWEVAEPVEPKLEIAPQVVVKPVFKRRKISSDAPAQETK